MAVLIMILKKLRIEWSLRKTVGPENALEYLGIILDTIAMECRLPKDKLDRLVTMISSMLGKSKCKQKEMLSLIGHLVFAARVIPAGRSFMSRLFQAAYSVKRLHHTISINAEAKADLEMWARFLSGWNGISLFLDLTETRAPDFDLYTDSSGKVGFGAYFQGQWFCSSWAASKPMLDNMEEDTSMSFKELVPIVIAAMLWGSRWSRKRILFHCDNQGTVHILNKARSKSADIMKLMRRFTLIAAQHSFAYQAIFLSTHENNIADSLSRLQMDRFRRLAPLADLEPCQIPCVSMLL